MTAEPVQLRLEASDGTAKEVPGTLQVFGGLDRFRRAAIVIGVAIIFAASLIPIPIIHLLGIPLVLLLGLFFTGRQLGITCRLMSARVHCPRCNGVNRIGGGLGMRSADEPLERACEVCRRTLQVRIIRQ